jgi:hypothetical protein
LKKKLQETDQDAIVKHYDLFAMTLKPGEPLPTLLDTILRQELNEKKCNQVIERLSGQGLNWAATCRDWVNWWKREGVLSMLSIAYSTADKESFRSFKARNTNAVESENKSTNFDKSSTLQPGIFITMT